MKEFAVEMLVALVAIVLFTGIGHQKDAPAQPSIEVEAAMQTPLDTPIKSAAKAPLDMITPVPYPAPRLQRG